MRIKDKKPVNETFNRINQTVKQVGEKTNIENLFQLVHIFKKKF